MAFREDIHRIEQLGRPPEVHTILPVITLPNTLQTQAHQLKHTLIMVIIGISICTILSP